MRCITILLLAIAVASSALAQHQTDSKGADAGATSFSENSNLPKEKLGANDLVGITVYDAPELTRTVRVEPDGFIHLPIVRQRIQVAGLNPAELETAISKILIEENVLVDPIVTVSVVEYRSRTITVSGAVRTPTTFQAIGAVSLLDAISRAGGLAENAGSEILVSHSPSGTNNQAITLTQRIQVRSLLTAEDPASNLALNGGDTIRVPAAGRIFVAGNVKHSGVFPITDGSESSVIKALALSEGLASFSGSIAYIYRTDDSSGRMNEIPVSVKEILARKSPDVPLYANDMLYVTTMTGRRTSAKAIAIVTGVGLSAAYLAFQISR